MTWSVRILPHAEADLAWLRGRDRALYVKCFDLIRSITLDPRAGLGKPERLRHTGSKEVWSRRVSQSDRIVYTIYEKDCAVEISSCRFHYEP